eukprot:CAMPEP_0197445216 /NCGR_PEP_ID=MMETSP1175-20131217/10485_1 /TAXON_ID=1003142 /ORGANISM="Triceratium dubium, Strain CCMP147" /LENGTH=508 /DNA_ID=CAMNT_0042976135 /DNA_START=140 /DNA_END=1666 /DNA_ORIENTATION=+
MSLSSSSSTKASNGKKINILPLAAAMVAILDASTVSALIPRQSMSMNRQKGSFGAGGTMTMYFDDVSRSKYTVPWLPTGVELRGVGPLLPTSSDSTFVASDSDESLARAKAKALQKLLYGYDVESAARLSEEKVMSETENWAQTTGLVGSNRNHSPYGEINGLHVCKSLSTLGCIAGFWSAVADTVSRNTNSYGFWDTGDNEQNQIVMVIFPNCADLYDYNTSSTVTAALEFCKDSSRYLGKDFAVSAYHPRWKNSPKMIDPMRHSPFPSFALHIAGEDERLAERKANREKQREESPKRSELKNNDEFVPQLSERRRNLEKLFHSAASSQSQQGQNFRSAELRNLSNDDIIGITKAWVRNNRFRQDLSNNAKVGTQSNSGTNRALQFADTIHDRWVVTNDELVESVYAKIWTAISDLNDFGQWVRSSAQESELAEPAIVSAMFIAPNFYPYSATDFRKFAVTVNAALKHLAGGKMFIELFHPEYVGPKGYHNTFRRSPAPAIQICYRL